MSNKIINDTENEKNTTTDKNVLKELISSFSLQSTQKNKSTDFEKKEEDNFEEINSEEESESESKEERSDAYLFNEDLILSESEVDMFDFMKNDPEEESNNSSSYSNDLLHKRPYDFENLDVTKNGVFNNEFIDETLEIKNDNLDELNLLFKDKDDNNELSSLKEITRGLSADLINMNLQFKEKEADLKEELKATQLSLQKMTSLFEFEKTKVETYKEIIKKKDNDLKVKSGELIEICENIEFILEKI